MRAVIQRVTEARVEVDGEVVGAIDHGLLVLLGVAPDDGDAEVDRLAGKLAQLRIFSDERGRFDRSLLDVRGGALVVSQFTLFGDARKGRRPSFTGAAPPDHARPLCDRFADRLTRLGVAPVAGGEFGAHMRVSLVNDGPVTLTLDTDDLMPR